MRSNLVSLAASIHVLISLSETVEPQVQVVLFHILLSCMILSLRTSLSLPSFTQTSTRFNISVFPGCGVLLLPISICGCLSVASPGILTSKSKIIRASIILISFAAKKRPGHACLPYPNAKFDSLVVTNWLRAWSVAVPPRRSL